MSTDFPDPPFGAGDGDDMEVDHLPDVYVSFRRNHPDVAAALDNLGAALDSAGTLDAKTRRLVKLGIAIGAEAKGAVRSNVRKALHTGARPDEIVQVAILALTTAGFPTTVAAYGWIEEVLAAEFEDRRPVRQDDDTAI